MSTQNNTELTETKMGIYINHFSVGGKNFTRDLKQGTTARFVDFAVKSALHRLQLNTMLTLRWHALWAEGAEYAYHSLPPRQRIAKSVELIRHYLSYRNVHFSWIWVQENNTDEKGLHWHLAFHCPPRLHNDLLNYIESHFGLERLPNYLVNDPNIGELGRSVSNAWQLEKEAKRQYKGLYLAAYLGKGEGRKADFSEAVKKAQNVGLLNLFNSNVDDFVEPTKKKHFLTPQGIIEGTQKDRFAISRIKFNLP